jgi:hypothetical protein
MGPNKASPPTQAAAKIPTSSNIKMAAAMRGKIMNCYPDILRIDRVGGMADALRNNPA